MAFDVQKTNIEITATDKTGAAFNAVKSSLTGLTAQFGALGGLLGAGAFAAMTKRIIDQADSMNDLSKRTGLAVEQIGAWRLATEQSGTSMEALTAALGKGSKYLVQHGDDLKKIGINAKTSEELILQLSGVISKMPSDDPRRTALAMQVLGKSAGELIPLLSEGEAGLRGMLERGRELNPFTADLAKNADIFNDNLAEMKMLSGGLFVNLVANILPSFNTYLKQLQMVVNDGDWMDKLLFFTVGYVPGKIANQTEKPEVQIQKYTQRIVELKKELADLSDGKFGYRKDGILKQIEEAEKGIAAQRQRSRGMISPRGRIGGGVSEEALDSFLKPDGGAPKKDAIAERIKALGVENTLLAQGVSIEDARTIARLKGDGATDQQIDKILNLTNAQTQYEDAEKKAEKTKLDLVKATQDHADAMQKMLETSDAAVLNAEREYEESQRNLQVMQLGESAVIRMESARLLEAASSAEQGLAYARLNGLSQENIDFTETQILRLKQLAEARLKFANSQDSNAAFEKEKDRIKDLEKEQKDSAKRVADEQKRMADDINRSLTDALLRGFESGKGFARNFRDTLKNMFQTLVLRPAINFALNSTGITGALGGLGSIFSGGASAGIPGASGGGIGGFTSTLESLSSLGSIFDTGNRAIVSGIESLGVFLAGDGTGLGGAFGGMIGQFSSEIANVLPYAGAAFSLLKGDVKGAAFSAAGTAIGTAIGGPIGGTIGAALGSVVGGLFGGKKQPPRTVTQLPEVNERFIQTLTALTKGFGLDSNITASARYSGRSGGSGYGFLNASVNGAGINEGIRYKDAYGEATMKQFIDTVLVGSVKKAIAAINLPEGIKKFFTDLTKQEEIAATINGLVAMNAQLKTLPPVFDAIRKALNTTDFNIGIAEVQKQFSDTSTFTSLFYTQQEQFTIFTDQLKAQLTDLNQVLPTTRDEYRSIVDAFKVTDEASSKLFGGLVALAPAMDAYFKQLEAQKGLLQPLSTDLFSTSSDFLAASSLAGNGKDFTSQIGELSTVRKKSDAESNAVVKALLDAQAETKAILEAVALAVQETARLQKIWNGDGLPETRVV
jgi:hypothetical protein